MKCFLFFAWALLSSMPAIAQLNQSENETPSDPHLKSSGKFGVILLLTEEPENVINDWNEPEPHGIKTASVARRGIPIAGFILFTGCAESQGLCNTEVVFTILKPDGSIYGSQSGVLWKKKAPPVRQIQLSRDYVGIRIEPQDPSGTYQVQAKVRDLNANLELMVSQTFVVEN